MIARTSPVQCKHTAKPIDASGPELLRYRVLRNEGDYAKLASTGQRSWVELELGYEALPILEAKLSELTSPTNGLLGKGRPARVTMLELPLAFNWAPQGETERLARVAHRGLTPYSTF